MKRIITLLIVMAAMQSRAQSPYHYEALANMHVSPTDEKSHVYTWVDTCVVMHSECFYIGQRFIDDEDKTLIWTIYEIDDLGASYLCNSRNGEGYMAYRMLKWQKFLPDVKYKKRHN